MVVFWRCKCLHIHKNLEKLEPKLQIIDFMIISGESEVSNSKGFLRCKDKNTRSGGPWEYEACQVRENGAGRSLEGRCQTSRLLNKQTLAKQSVHTPLFMQVLHY